MLSDHLQFCSLDANLRNAEPLYGTAIQADRCVFISWPRRYWAEKTLEARHFPAKIRDAIEHTRKQSRTRFFLFDKDIEVDAPSLSLLCMPCGTERDVLVDDMPTIISAYGVSCSCAGALSTTLSRSVFVCTHSVRDNCCAKFGYGFARQLRKQFDSAGYDCSVFETSHLGGDRFAGTAISFPDGRMYGWLRPEDAALFAQAIMANRPFTSKYRGLIYLDRIPQVAEAFARSVLGSEFHLCAPIDIAVGPESHGRVAVELGLKDNKAPKTIGLILERKTFEFFSSCSALQGNEPTSGARWIVSEWAHL